MLKAWEGGDSNGLCKSADHYSCKKVCFWLQVREKGRKEAAEWCLVSIRQVWNWCNKDANISVSNLFNLADFPNCRPEDLLISHPMPEGRE